jgi:Ca2+-binding EF-hand superfamily protein
MTLQLPVQAFLRKAFVFIGAAALAAPAFGQTSARRFQAMDDNGDGVISRSEWRGSLESFRRHDWNNDGVISGDEVQASARRDSRHDDDEYANGWRSDPADRFEALDADGNGRISRREWTGSAETFEWLDRNNDGELSRYEVVGDEAETGAYLAGQDRGLADGRKAGREDKVRRNAWDLDGQRELEQADAGYHSDLGPRAEYQAGYRKAFRTGYREGFDLRY